MQATPFTPTKELYKKDIVFFKAHIQNKNSQLSNFSKCNLTTSLGGTEQKYPSAEHAFQALSCVAPCDQYLFEVDGPLNDWDNFFDWCRARNESLRMDPLTKVPKISFPKKPTHMKCGWMAKIAINRARQLGIKVRQGEMSLKEKKDLLRQILRHKFCGDKNPGMQKLLLSTGTKMLIEPSRGQTPSVWEGYVKFDDSGKVLFTYGKNVAGRILMEVRQEILNGVF